MNHCLAIAGSDIAFECAGGESVLDAKARAGIDLPYSCRKGVCGSCVAVGQPLRLAARKRFTAEVFRNELAAPDLSLLQFASPLGSAPSSRLASTCNSHCPTEARAATPWPTHRTKATLSRCICSAG